MRRIPAVFLSTDFSKISGQKEKAIFFFREHYYNKKPYKQIATETGHSWKTVASYVHRERWRRGFAIWHLERKKINESLKMQV